MVRSQYVLIVDWHANFAWRYVDVHAMLIEYQMIVRCDVVSNVASPAIFLQHEFQPIHFHDDDLYDCGWQTDFSLTVPQDLRSGLYAMRLFAEDDEFYIPLAIRPPPGRGR